MRLLAIASFVLASALGLSLVAAAEPGSELSFAGLPSLRFSNQSTRQSALVRLYDDLGHVDEAEAARLDALLADTRDPKNCATITLDRRTLQLAVRAALHFRVTEVQVVSAYRKPGRRREGPHASGKAIDFKLPGVPARTLAAYLRKLPRVGGWGLHAPQDAVRAPRRPRTQLSLARRLTPGAQLARAVFGRRSGLDQARRKLRAAR